MKKRLLLCVLYVCCSLVVTRTLAQTGQSTVSGTVTNEAGEPLGAVNVQLKGTSSGAVTDKDGKYTLQLTSRQGILVFSSIGFAEQEVSINGRSTINITMSQKSSALNDVVVIGYGKQSRAGVTTSISKVGEQEFEHAPGANPLMQMQGKVAGLSLQISDGQPGANPQIILRGGTTTSPESDAPLMIVDGVISQGLRSISDLNPDDVETIQVLKDAASTAIYGARAANGIIIVTTKSGKSGKPRIGFKYTHGIEQQGNQYNFLNARDYIYITRLNTMKYNTSNPNFFLTGGRFGMSTGNPRNSKNTVEFLDKYIADYGQEYVDELLNNQGWETMEDPVTGDQLIFKNTDFQEVTFQTAYKQEYDFNISGGSDKATYYLGLGYLNQDGIVYGTFYKNYSALFKSTYKLSDRFTINAGVNYQARRYNSPNNYQNVLSRSVDMSPTYRLYYEDGLPGPGEGVGSFRSRLHEVYYKERYTKINIYRTTLQLGADWSIIDGLSFSPQFSWFTSEAKDNYFEAYNEANKNRPASAGHDLDKRIQVDGLLNYIKTLGSRHNFHALAGASYINDYAYRMSGSGRGAPTDYIPTLNATQAETQRISTTESTDVLASYFGRLNYDFDKKYLFSASFRMDGSSRFASENKWGVFPGVSAGWNMHSEDFFAPMRKYISQFKVRASWGQTGNNVLSIFDSQGRYGTGYNYMGNVGILNTTLANNELVWENTTSFDVGFDIGLFNNRVTLLVDYYNKLTSGRLFNKPLDATTGFSSIKSNYGSIRNTGFEVELTANPVKTRNFSWDIGMTFSWNKGVVVELPDNGEDKNRTGGNFVFDPKQQKYVKVGGFAEGEQFGQRWAYDLIGVYATDADGASAPFDVETAGRTKMGGDAIWRDVDRNDTIDFRDMVFMGYMRPNKIGGMVNTLQYKSLTLRFVMDFAVGHVIDNGFRARTNGSARNNNNGLTDVLGDDIWKDQGDIASIPRYNVQSDVDYNWRNHLRANNGIGNSGYSSNNSLYYSKGDFLAFREVSLNYNLKAPFLGKAYIQSVDLFAGVFNIGYITAYDGLMPEVYDGSDQGEYPRPRQYNLGIKANF